MGVAIIEFFQIIVVLYPLTVLLFLVLAAVKVLIAGAVVVLAVTIFSLLARWTVCNFTIEGLEHQAMGPKEGYFPLLY